MPTKTIDFKDVQLTLNNSVELYVECEVWDGASYLGRACVIVNVTNKTKTQIRDEAKELLRAQAAMMLEAVVPVIDLPASIPDFNLSVTYE